jgi:hypothetical protein
MEARLAPYPDYQGDPSQIADAYRVTLWEQPEQPDADREHLAWHEMTFDLPGAQDVREAIGWAEAKLASNEGPLSEDGVPVQDQEYVVFAKVPRESGGCR